MAYEYTTRRPVARPRARLSGMGRYSNPRESCNNPANGCVRCFTASDTARAGTMRCVNQNSACTVSGETGTNWCCPGGSPRGCSAGTSSTNQNDAAPVTSTTTPSTESQDLTKPTSGVGFQMNKPGVTVDGLAQRASDVAREVADTEYDANMPIESDGSSSDRGSEEQPWYERYSTHITIGSTVIGLGTFLIWLAVRKK